MKIQIRLALVGAAVFAFGSIAAQAHEPELSRDPADPDAPVAHLVYRSVLSGYDAETELTDPGDWRALNDLMEEIGGPAGQLRDADQPASDR